MHFVQKVGIEILRAVREEHHEGHQHGKIKKPPPVLKGDTNHLAGAGHAVLLPGFRFGHFGADVKCQ